VRFALVDRGPRPEAPTDASIELILPGGERLRIAAGVDATLRMVLEALRPGSATAGAAEDQPHLRYLASFRLAEAAPRSTYRQAGR
jgi:hypothetical protein